MERDDLREREKRAGIPIVVGVTGHRRLRPQDVPHLRELVAEELKKLRSMAPDSELVVLSSVASGADTLCAEEALALGIPLICALPMPTETYRQTFAPAELPRLDALLAAAAEVFVVRAAEPEPPAEDRHFRYRQASIYVAAHCHVLLALWDGAPGNPGGCGTAEAVGFALHGGWEGAEACLKSPYEGAVVHITAPREGAAYDGALAAELLEEEPGSLRRVLETTNGFNRAAGARGGADARSALVPPEYLEHSSPALRRVHALNRTAAALSRECRKKYMRAMGAFSLFGVLLILFFLLYDELDSNLFLIFYGALLGVYVAVFFHVRRRGAHAGYLRWRMLTEALRVQFYLLASGSAENVGAFFTWTQRQESAWVKAALAALLIGPVPERTVPDDVLRDVWIDGQLVYHRAAGGRDAGSMRVNETVSLVMLFCSLALFLAVLVTEFCFAPSMEIVCFRLTTPFPLLHGEAAITLRALFKILLGIVSGVTAFLSNYYGKLSFERKSLDHARMTALYAAAKARYADGSVPHERLFAELAREEIIENGNWVSYCRENTPSFNV